MTTPEQDEPQRLNEPEHLEAEGYLNRALRRLGEGLGRFVFEKIQDKELLVDEEKLIVTRDLSVIFGKMERNWNRLGLGPDEWNRMGLLIGFRNGPWAHLKGYSDYDVHQCLGDAARLLEAVAADEQAQAVEQMWSELGKLIFSDTQPASHRDANEFSEPQQFIELLPRMTLQQFSELQTEMSRVIEQLEGSRFTAPPIASTRDTVDGTAPVPAADTGAPSDALPIAPDSAGEFLSLGDEARREGYIEDALDYYSRAIELNPNLVEAYVGLGNTYMDGEEYESAIAGYGEALRLDPNDAVIYFYRGSAYAALDEYDSAISDYSDALRHNPTDSLAVAGYGNRGNAYRIQGEYDRAIADYNAALNLNPNDEVAAGLYFNRGNVYRVQGEYDSAIADCNEALRLHPEIVEAYAIRGFAYSCLGEYDLAIADCDMALQLHPEDELAYSTRGYAYFVKGEYDLAIADFESMLSLESDDDLAELAREGIRLAQGSKERSARLRDKATEYDQHIEGNPDDPEGWYLRGVHFLLDVGDNERAFTDFSKQAIDLKSDFAEAYYNRAWVWRRRGDHGNAIIDFSQAIAHKPNYAAAYHHRGQSYFFIGERDSALADFEKARSLGYEP